MIILSNKFVFCNTFYLYGYVPNPYIHSFPTRRSSDLQGLRSLRDLTQHLTTRADDSHAPPVTLSPKGKPNLLGGQRMSRPGKRSEEHTSELQSRFDLVCRLLLEKKNILLIKMCCNNSDV